MSKQDATITVLTPAYNRAGHLKQLYESLKAQTVPAFAWMIVDDGSTDETQRTVEEFRAEGQLRIRCLQRPVSGGKHRALNEAIPTIDTELTFIVDSDDYLPPDAIGIILRCHEKYRDHPGLCGYSFLRCYPDGTVNDARFKQDGEIASYRDVRINGQIAGDKAEVFFTRVLQRFPFPEYEGEKYLPEDLVWMQMSGPYKFVHINQCVYIGEYLEGGLTKTGRRMKVYSPRGMRHRSLVYLQDPQVRWRVKLKMMLLYIIYGRFAGISFGGSFAEAPAKPLFLLCWLPAGLLYHRWKRENLGR